MLPHGEYTHIQPARSAGPDTAVPGPRCSGPPNAYVCTCTICCNQAAHALLRLKSIYTHVRKYTLHRQRTPLSCELGLVTIAACIIEETLLYMTMPTL